MEWQKELIIQGFDSETQEITELVEFCKRLEIAEEIIQTQDEVNHQNQKQNKQSGERHQSAKSAQIKGSYQAAKSPEEDAEKKNKEEKITCVPSAWTWTQHELV